jgi:hypothetical protein
VEDCGGSVDDYSTVSKSPVTPINTTFEPLGSEKCGGSGSGSVEEVWITETPTNTDLQTENGKSVEDLEQKTQPLENTSSAPSLPNEKTESIKNPSTASTVLHTFDETLTESDLQSVEESSTVICSHPQSSTLSYQGFKIGDQIKGKYRHPLDGGLVRVKGVVRSFTPTNGEPFLQLVEKESEYAYPLSIFVELAHLSWEERQS